jgi:anti-sigma regulatory factor (Ser/Thr protein kinase)
VKPPKPVIGEARARLLRVLYLASGIGAIVFGGLLATGGGGIIAQHSQLAPPYAFAALLIAIVIPASFVVVAFVLPLPAMRVIAGGTAIGFLLLQLAWVPAMAGPMMEGNAPSWLQGVTALHATIAAIVWQHRYVWSYALLQGPMVALTGIWTREGEVRAAILDGAGGMLFCLILMGVAIAVIAAADRQDAAAERARSQASIEASRRTRDREQNRINAIVHDDVMSVLLTAGRDAPPESLAQQATVALASIERLNEGTDENRTYAPEEVVAVMRSTVSDIAAHVDFAYELDGNDPVPAVAVAALTEALGEAMRNSVLHGARKDQDVTRSVRVAVNDKAISVVAKDNGPGFSMRAVPERRLGIRVSILQRMETLQGGAGAIASRPGKGTTVTLLWNRS